MSNNYTSALGVSGGIQPTGDAVEANVLAGKTFSNASGVGKTGTMVNNGAVSETLDAGESYTIPEGYHNGSGVVTAANADVLTNAELSGINKAVLDCAKKFLGNSLVIEFWGASLGQGPQINVIDVATSTNLYAGVPTTSHQTQTIDLSSFADDAVIRISDQAGSSSGTIYCTINPS